MRAVALAVAVLVACTPAEPPAPTPAPPAGLYCPHTADDGTRLHGEPPLCSGRGHRRPGASCANCYEWAHRWHARIVDSLAVTPIQLALAL